MLTPLTPNQQKAIVNNVLKACKDITKLNSTGYKFINLANGFIAHYNLYGFIAHYSTESLSQDIVHNSNSNMWNNFHPGEADYDYYMSKKAVYKAILDELTKGMFGVRS